MGQLTQQSAISLLHFFAGFLQGLFVFLQGLSAILRAQALSFEGAGIQYTGKAASSMIYTNRTNDIIEALNFKWLFSLRA